MTPELEQKLTAYALNELDDSERHEIEALLADDATARDHVAQTRALAEQLRTELANEPIPASVPQPIPASWRWIPRIAAMAAAVAIASGVTAIAMRSTNQVPDRVVIQSPATRPTTTPAQVGTIPVLVTNAQQLIRETRYKEALGVVDQILLLDPANGYALGVRPLVADKALIQEHRFYREDFDHQYSKHLNATDEKGIPYDDIPHYEVADGQLLEVAAARAEAQRRHAVARHSEMRLSQQRAAANRQEVESTIRHLSDNVTQLEAEGRLREADGVRAQIALLTGTNEVNPNPAKPVAPGGPIPDVGDSEAIRVPSAPGNTEGYAPIQDNPFLAVAQNPLSTFSIDGDTASYANMRRFIEAGQLPPADAVRIEELVNYFPYDYAPPAREGDRSDDGAPFAAHIEVAGCPWNPDHRLVRVGLKGYEIPADQRPQSNLVFLIDVSGSMQDQNKLPLVRQSLQMLVDQLRETDRVSIVVYAGSSGLVLPSTSGADKRFIRTAIDRLQAGGSTNGAQGIELAYQIAQDNFIKDGTNRVILCTDGDFNVGVTDQESLVRLIEDKARSGVFLSVLGFGMGNLKDSTMELLADKGNGNYGYIDSLSEARKTLVEQMSGTLVTIAKDVKIQIEFNPAQASAYRLIGYENRLLAKEDFNDDTKDAGEIGAGHTVTALYEVVSAGASPDVPAVDPLKYQTPATPPAGEASDELLTLKLRYKQPDGDTSRLMEVPVRDDGQDFATASDDFKFASSVAAFGMLLRNSPHRGTANFADAATWARAGLGNDPGGYRQDYLRLLDRAAALQPDEGDKVAR